MLVVIVVQYRHIMDHRAGVHRHRTAPRRTRGYRDSEEQNQFLTRIFNFLLASSGAGEDLRGSLESFSYTEEEFSWGYAIPEGFNTRHS